MVWNPQHSRWFSSSLSKLGLTYKIDEEILANTNLISLKMIEKTIKFG